MIGMMNMGGDADFYAAARQSSLYKDRNSRRSTIEYTTGGRKMLNGKPQTEESPDEMWEQLLLRAITAKVKDSLIGEKIQERSISSSSLNCVQISISDHEDDASKEQATSILPPQLSPLSQTSKKTRQPRKLQQRCVSESKLDSFLREHKAQRGDKEQLRDNDCDKDETRKYSHRVNRHITMY